MADRKAIIDKIRKLLAMGNSGNEHEAMAFLERGQAMLAEHNLTEADLGEVADFMVADAPAAPDWQQRINLAVAKLYFCRYFVAEWTAADGHAKQLHSFVGEEHNVRVAQMMADYIIKRIEALVLPGAELRYFDDRRLYTRSFCHQASLSVALRIKHRILASMADGIQEEGTTLPALRSLYDKAQDDLQKFLDQQFGDSSRAGVPQLDRHDPDGLEQGQAAGDSIGLDQQVGRARSVGLLR